MEEEQKASVKSVLHIAVEASATYGVCAPYMLHAAYVGGLSNELIRCVICNRGRSRNM